MKTRAYIRHIAVISILLTLGSSMHSIAAVVSWNASSGLTPDQSGFQLYNTSDPETPVLNSSLLTISNDSASEQMMYRKIAPSDELQFPAVFEAAFRMKYVSGTSSAAGRTATGLQVTSAPHLDSTLWIGQDILFLGAGAATSRGPAATLDTDSAFHDYLFRIAGNTVSVFQDGNLVISGNTLSQPGNAYATPRIMFGDISALASGTSEWESFRHNAAIPEPASALLILLMTPLMIIRRIFRIS